MLASSSSEEIANARISCSDRSENRRREEMADSMEGLLKRPWSSKDPGDGNEKGRDAAGDGDQWRRMRF
jgi:hypothetical protein